MMKYFVIFLLPACLLCAVEDRSSAQGNVVAFKVKRDAVFESGESQDSPLFEKEVHSRKKRSDSGKKSYIFLDNRSGKTAKLYWRDVKKKDPARYYTSLTAGQTIGLNTYDNHEWTAKDIFRRSLMMNDKRGVLQKGNTEATRSVVIIKNIGQRNTDIGDRYVEMMVVVDKAVIGRHRNDEEVKRYVLTYLKLASAILQHSDITKYGLKIHLVLAKLVLLRRDLSDVRLDPDERENNLRKVCNYMNKIGNGGSRKYDHKLFLTRNDFGMGGYANTRGMCSHYTSCSMVYDHGFTASFLVAHELAHSFGVDDRDFGQNSGFVMSRMVDARFNQHRWSTYSQIAMLTNIRKYSCVNNKPVTLRNLPLVNKYPGVHYSFAQQCHLEYDKKYSAWTGRGDPCTRLKCRMPPPYTLLAKTTGSSALDGTTCGANKWCLSGKCTSRTGAVSSKGATATVSTTRTLPRVDGGWGRWGQWSRCSRTCSTGVQTRDRMCNKPLPRNGGRYCVGTRRQVKMCDTARVCPKRVSEKDAVCVVAGRKNVPGRTWKFYDDSAANLDCTFEAGTCGWSNDKTTGLKQWTLHKGRTPSSYTGPSVDQTLKTSKGQYIYFESSTPSKAKAVLSSPFIKIRQGCLEFSYHMWGDNKMGQLKVVKFTGGVSTVLWRMSGNKGNQWYRQKINVQNYSPYKLSFLAKKKGAGYKSDIALDDITFRSGLCSSSSTTQKKVEEKPCKIKCITSDKKSPTRIMFPVHVYDGTTCSTKTTTGVCYRGICKTVGCDNILTDGKKGNCVISTGRRQGKTQQPVRPKSTITRTITRTTTTRSRSRLNCDFNRNFCHWRNLAAKTSQNIRGNDLNWLRQREGRTGYYLRIRPSRQKGIKVGSIASPEVKVARACLSFSYKLSRKGAYSRLRVKWLVRYGNAQVSRTKRYLSVTESWKEEKIDFQISQSYKIVFEATLSAGLTGIIGIDNIRFDPGRCPSNKG